MNALGFSKESFVLYQMLPCTKKIHFVYDVFNDDIKSVALEYFKTHFGIVASNSHPKIVSMITYLSPDGDKVNIIFENDKMHINCDNLKPIQQVVMSIMLDGNIIYRDNRYKKTPENSDKFFMKYYYVYTRVNKHNILYPICLS